MAKGKSLDAHVRAPLVNSKRFGDQAALDVSASYDEATKTTCVFIVNRSTEEAITTDIVFQSGAPKAVQEAWQLAGGDVNETNTWKQPNKSAAKKIKTAAIQDGKLRMKLPPLSFTAVRLQ